MIYTIKLNKNETLKLINYYADKIAQLRNRKLSIEDSLKYYNYFREHRTYGSLKNELKSIKKEIKFLMKISKPLLEWRK